MYNIQQLEEKTLEELLSVAIEMALMPRMYLRSKS